MCLQAFVMCNWTELEEERTLDSVVISLSRSSICLMSFIAVKESVTDSSPWYAVTFRVESIVKEEVTEIWRCVLESDMKCSSSSVGHQDNQFEGIFCEDNFSCNYFKVLSLFLSMSAMCEVRLSCITLVNWSTSLASRDKQCIRTGAE